MAKFSTHRQTRTPTTPRGRRKVKIRSGAVSVPPCLCPLWLLIHVKAQINHSPEEEGVRCARFSVRSTPLSSWRVTAKPSIHTHHTHTHSALTGNWRREAGLSLSPSLSLSNTPLLNKKYWKWKHPTTIYLYKL